MPVSTNQHYQYCKTITIIFLIIIAVILNQLYSEVLTHRFAQLGPQLGEEVTSTFSYYSDYYYIKIIIVEMLLVFTLVSLFAARPFPPQQQTFLPRLLVSPANVCLIYHIKEKPRKYLTFTFSTFTFSKSRIIKILLFLLFLILC